MVVFFVHSRIDGSLLFMNPPPPGVHTMVHTRKNNSKASKQSRQPCSSCLGFCLPGAGIFGNLAFVSCLGPTGAANPSRKSSPVSTISLCGYLAMLGWKRDPYVVRQDAKRIRRPSGRESLMRIGPKASRSITARRHWLRMYNIGVLCILCSMDHKRRLEKQSVICSAPC